MISGLVNHIALDDALRNPSGWRGSLDGRPTFFEKDVFAEDGYKITLHKFVGADDPECFHSHPAIAIRCVLSGGYVEEYPGGEIQECLPGFIGLVYPDTVHRIHSLLETESVSLWIRMPKTAEAKLIGDGWRGQAASMERNDV